MSAKIHNSVYNVYENADMSNEKDADAEVKSLLPVPKADGRNWT